MSDFPPSYPPLDSEEAVEFTAADAASVYKVIQARRDIRHFTNRPISQEILNRVLQAAHAAPSVGFLQPWNFILIESLAIRQQIKNNFEAITVKEKVKASREGRGDLYSSFRLEGILDSALNIAVTCDSSRQETFVLGRDPQPKTAPYSVCLAIQNLWLAARVESLGVGWVSILDHAVVAEILDLPKQVELIAYLCLGYPVAFRAKPMLEELGWKNRAPLESLVFHEKWGATSSSNIDKH